jgi:hypothetical protein
MKRFIVVIGAGIALTVAASQVGHAQQAQPAVFRIVVEPSATGLKATCVNGCAWKELSFDFKRADKQPCKAEIDQLGVGGVK